MCRFMFILIFLLWKHGYGFEVRFQETLPSYHISSDFDAETEQRLHKREMQQFFDKAGYSFDGLVRVASVPVPFPLDICMLQLPTVKYATTLHKDTAGVHQFAVYIWRAREQDYALLLQQPAPKAVALDCLAYAGLGFVALSLNHTEPVRQAREGSPIFELSAERGLRTVQYFAGQRLRSMYLRISSQELTLLHAYDGGDTKKQQRCPYFKWTGATFQQLGSIPCSNARRLEAFGIDYADYVAVANYASADGRTSTHSEIYRYDAQARRFQLFQRLRSNGAVDIKYFSLPVNEVSRRHFLILGNSVGSARAAASQAGEADTVIYVFDNGQFVPYQRLSFDALERFLPVTHSISEKFLLFVVCSKQDVKIYNLNDWKFEESTVQFTEGAFSRGVARMRSYEENEQSYLVIANENMAANETNIFQPLYKQDEHANVLRQQIIEWAREQRKRLEQINVDQLVQNLKQKLEETQKHLKRMHIKLVNAKALVDPHQKLTTNYWDALRYAKRALDVIELDAARAQRRPAKRAVEDQHEFDEITVGTLVVHEKLQAQHINGVNREQPVYESISASKVYVSEEYKEAASEQLLPQMEQLSVQDLQLEGKLNGHNWTELLEQTLKRRGSEVQFIKSPVDISNLRAEAVLVNGNEINDRPLSQLISIDGGDYIVQQDVQFAQPIEVNRLVINQRLNHIHVDRQRFDVLLHQANHTQVIEGVKRFENIRVLEPITIAGQLLGSELIAMSPMKVTHQSLELQGDYVIDGDVTIGQLLQVQDLIEASTQRSAAATLQQALRVNQPLENINLRFEQPLSANDTKLSFINAQDLQFLVQLNVDEVQFVEGAKWLPQSLTVSQGFAEVNILNGVNVEKLSKQLLLKSGNQTFAFPMQLGGLQAPQINATKLLLNGVELEQYLRKSGDQRSNSSLYVEQLQVEELQVIDLLLHGTIFGHTLEELSAQGTQRAHSWQLPENFNGTIQARNMWLKGHLNDASVAQLEQQLQQLAGNIKYVGDFTFRQPMNITGLHFGISLNGIEAHRFGHCWLESSGQQQFTAPQTLAAVASDQDVVLQGRLNNYTLEKLVNGSYRLNGTEQLPAVKFVNPIVLQDSLSVGRLNGLRVPEDMLYAQGGGMLQAPMKINGQLVVAIDQCNVSALNGFQLDALAQYLREDSALDTLHVEHAEFEAPPQFEQLNGRQLQTLLDKLWLDNELVQLKAAQLDSASFEGLLEFEGTLNGLDVNHIGGDYFSCTRSQHLNVPLYFDHDVTFAQTLAAQRVQLRVKDGALVEGIGNFSLNFDDFVANTLKTAGEHNVTGHWSIHEAHVPGDLNNVLINQLNLVDDVLRNDTKGVTLINAPKTATSAIIKRLFATPTSTVCNVPVAQWINNTVYIYGNHSIAGTTILETLNLYNDLRVVGPVNGIHWQPDQLMLCDKDQQLAGSLLIENALPEQHRILSSNIEELWVDRINGLNVNELLENKAHNRPNLHVASQLIFAQPLSLANFEPTAGYKWKRGVSKGKNSLEDWQQLAEHVAAVQQRLAEPAYILKNFAVLQQFPFNVSQLKTLYDQDLKQDVLGIWHTDKRGVQHVERYVWQAQLEQFEYNASKWI
ncbi:GH22859 [Drosophila grimshawi]|uniref:GH22859 n=1 Tax=Drosophila grimshawi TaxID=7222 RepID=B4JVW9_DROGR|nr:GH22859 [Drosophila grimshawi]